MFSAKNYGLPKDLIEAAKRVHEKQLEEGVGKYAEPRVNPKIHKQEKEVKNILHDLAGRKKEEMNKELPGAKKPQAKKPQTEEVQFTEEELAEAFAIFLEENFHVEMLTEEDLDFVFENEFPQWLEEQERLSFFRALKRKFGFDKPKTKPVVSSPTFPGEDALIKKEQEKATATAVQSDTGGPGETGVGDKIPPLPTRKPNPAAREQVRAKPTSTARKQVKRSAPKPQSFGALLRKVGGNAPATTATAAGRRKVALLDARARARTAARDARVRRSGGLPSWAKKAFNSDN